MEREFFIIRWSKFFITRYRISILVMLAIVIAGMWGVSNNQRQDFPTIGLNFVIVSAVYPGASPADIEQEIIIPIEQTANSYDEVDYARSNSQSNYGSIEVFLKEAGDAEKIVTKLGDDISKLGLPSDAEVDVFTIDATGPSVAFGIIGLEGQGTTELLQYANDVKTRLESASSELKYIELIPTDEYEITIVLNADEMAKRKLTYDLVKGAIQSQIVSLPGGTVQTSEGKKESITIHAPVQSFDSIKSIPLGAVTLQDIAEVTRVPKNNDASVFIGYVKDGEPKSQESVYLMAYKNDDGDIITMSEDLHAEVDDIKAAGILPDNVDIVTGYNTAPFIDDQINSLLNNGYIGLIVILIVLLFFINLRASIVVALVIPMVFLIALFVLAALGYTLNILTLFALILTLGILVDNAIVITEGMMHEIEKGESKKSAALISIKKLGPAVTAATLTTVVVFIPFASIGGIMGDFLKYIPYTIIIVIVASYLVAMSITPLLGRWILKKETYDERRAKKIKSWEKYLVIPAIVHYGQNIIDGLAQLYKRLMKKIFTKLSYKLLVVIIITALFGLSFGFFAPQLDFEQMPTKDGDTMQVQISFPAGTTTADKNEVFTKVQDELITLPYFENYFAFQNVVFGTFTAAKFRDDKMTIFEIEDQYNQKLDVIRQDIPDDIEITAQSTSYGPPTDQFDIVVNLLGTNDEALINAANDLEQFLLDKEGISEIINGPRESLVPSIDVNLNQEELQKRGVNSIAAAGTINAIFAPQNIGSIVLNEDGTSDDIALAFSDTSTDSVDDLRNLTVPSANRGLVKLADIAEIKQVDNPISIRRLENKRVATVSVGLDEGVNSAILDQEIKDYLTEEKLIALGLPKDGVTYGGEFSTFESDYSKLQIVFLLAILAVYLILVWQFYSYMQPALIIFAIPLALIGVFPGLLLVGSSLNMISGLGVIALVGVVVNDAIVFISTYNRYKEEFPNDPMNKILVRTGYQRFKPIFSTSITTIGGIIPLTIADPFWTGLGTAIIAGLIFSTIGTLIAIPVLYSLATGAMAKIFRKPSPDTVPAENTEPIQ